MQGSVTVRNVQLEDYNASNGIALFSTRSSSSPSGSYGGGDTGINVTISWEYDFTDGISTNDGFSGHGWIAGGINPFGNMSSDAIATAVTTGGNNYITSTLDTLHTSNVTNFNAFVSALLTNGCATF